MNKEVNIEGKVYPLAYNLRAIVLFEKIAEKSFSIDNVTDWVILIYACLLAANRETDIMLEEFIDQANQKEVRGCIEWLTKQMAINNQLSKTPDDGKAKKKSHSGKSTG